MASRSLPPVCLVRSAMQMCMYITETGHAAQDSKTLRVDKVVCQRGYGYTARDTWRFFGIRITIVRKSKTTPRLRTKGRRLQGTIAGVSRLWVNCSIPRCGRQ